MITPQDAIRIIEQHIRLMPESTHALREAAGLCLAQPVYSAFDHPFFDQSAVDGYALSYRDIENGTEIFRVQNEVRAGAEVQALAGAGYVTRIFTGGQVHPSSDTVVMQEWVEKNPDGTVRIPASKVKRGDHIRRSGEQIRAGGQALPAGLLLDAAGIGFLAGLGVNEVAVRRKPRVHIFVTGDEFAASAGNYEEGKIFESNGVMLVAALREAGIAATYTQVPENLEVLRSAIAEKMENCDLLLLTGGVSVGEYDFTRAALEQNQFEVLFHSVKQQPGKPLLFARSASCMAFGLPGNPRSVLSCFYVYVWHWIRAAQGCSGASLPKLLLSLTAPVHKKSGRSLFLTGRFDGSGIRPDPLQGSHILQGFAGAEVLIHLPAESEEISAGTLAEIFLLPV